MGTYKQSVHNLQFFVMLELQRDSLTRMRICMTHAWQTIHGVAHGWVLTNWWAMCYNISHGQVSL
jgi:hypothetical protein